MMRVKRPNFTVIRLARWVHKIDYFGKLTHSQYTSVGRAVKRLYDKGYVEAETITPDDERFPEALSLVGKLPTKVKIVNPGPRMYEEKEWLNWIKKWDKKQ